MRILLLIVAMCFLFGALATPARADVIRSPPQGYTVILQEADDVQTLASYTTLNGIPFNRELDTKTRGLTEMLMEWAPKNIPVQITLRRRNEGYSLLFSSRIRDVSYGRPCFVVKDIDAVDLRSVKRFWRKTRGEFQNWYQKCPSLASLRVEEMLTQFELSRDEIVNATKAIKKPKLTGIISITKGFSTASFYPETFDQNLLDAVASSCNFPASNLKINAYEGIDFERLDERSALQRDKSSQPSAYARNECVEMTVTGILLRSSARGRAEATQAH